MTSGSLPASRTTAASAAAPTKAGRCFASVGYQFDPRWSVQGGWRYMAIEKEIDGRDLEVDLNGPLLGVTIRF